MQKEITKKLEKLTEGKRIWRHCTSETSKESISEKVEYPIPGRTYEHYKGGLYRVDFLSRHTETNEVLVNYTSLIFGSHYSRPLSIWNSRPEEHKLRFLLQR